MRKILALIVVLLGWGQSLRATPVPFDLVTRTAKVSIVYAADDPKVDSIAAHLLAQDIQRITGYLPPVHTELAQARGNVILIGTIQSSIMKSLNDPFFRTIQGKWECYTQKVIRNLSPTITQALVIAGSDSRGTAYGVFNLSEKIGVSPWYWWADVTPARQTQLSVSIEPYASESPSVKFRGIFINDEDWGLQPWAAQTFEPKLGNIGPKTYEKVFELLLRLKANLIWPGMHDCTLPFFSIPENKQLADAYEIIVGSSHAEPMLRSNVREWDKKTMGAFNYVTNRPAVYQYWEDRVKQAGPTNTMYSIGMRGVHDSAMEGVKTPQEAVPLLETIFADQRTILRKYVNTDILKVPQVLTLYKEVLDIYGHGLSVPEDVTLIWPDDNYGYIHQLSNPREAKRSGGSGVYYHISYWGRPHDYLWMMTTHPALIREEMTKAYTLQARQVWVVNVGDIKACEYGTQLFLDMAYRIEPFLDSRYSKQHLNHWLGDLFGKTVAPALTQHVWEFYDLAFERRPEFMGWSQTEPTTPIKPQTAYTHHFFNDQAQRRLDRYEAIEKAAEATAARIPESRKSAYYQLIQYPLVGASLMNKKFLYRDKAYAYEKQGRWSARHFADLSKQAYDGILKETEYFNTKLAQGKWKGMMSMKPRNLPVFSPIEIKSSSPVSTHRWRAIPEGHTDSTATLALPDFHHWNQQKFFVDVFLSSSKKVSLEVKPSANWIKVSQTRANLTPSSGTSDARIWVEIDWTKAPRQLLSGAIRITGAGQTVTVTLKADHTEIAALKNYKGFVENAGFIAIDAARTSARTSNKSAQWAEVQGLGSAGKALQALPFTAQPTVSLTDTAMIGTQPSVSYEFYTFQSAPAQVNIYTLPTFPLTNEQEARYAVRIDGGPLTIHTIKTVGRTEEWKQNVLSNSSVRTLTQPTLAAGKHTLTIYKIDPGVVLDRIFIALRGGKVPYGAISPVARSVEK